MLQASINVDDLRGYIRPQPVPDKLLLQNSWLGVVVVGRRAHSPDLQKFWFDLQKKSKPIDSPDDSSKAPNNSARDR